MDPETQLRIRNLSFYDFDDNKSLLSEGNQTKRTPLGFDDSDTEDQSVDEGSIAILSMDEIRNMKNLEAAYLKTQDKFREQLRQSQGFVKPPAGKNLEKLEKTDSIEAEALDEENETPQPSTLAIVVGSLNLNNEINTPQTPRQSAFTDLQQEIGGSIDCVDSSKLTNKLNAFIEKNQKLDDSSHSIDNGDIGSTKDYDNKNDNDVS